MGYLHDFKAELLRILDDLDEAKQKVLEAGKAEEQAAYVRREQ